jgi:hypothetical protein
MAESPKNLFRLACDPADTTWDHAEGWPYLLDALHDLIDPASPVVFDDAIERSFTFYREKWRMPDPFTAWFSVSHYPPDLPAWYNPDCKLLGTVTHLPPWQARLDKLRFTIVLSSTAADYIREVTGKPVVVLKYPTGYADVQQWEPDRFIPNLMQVGWFLRDTTAIYRVNAPAFQKIRLTGMRREWVQRSHERCQQHLPQSKQIGDVAEVSWLSNAQYDTILSTGVVFSHFITVAASTMVGECVARATPLLTNRHPALEEYLGKGYPLFYDSFDQIPDMLTPDRVIAAHEHMKKMDRSWTNVANFREGLVSACLKHIPELRERLDI